MCHQSAFCSLTPLTLSIGRMVCSYMDTLHPQKMVDLNWRSHYYCLFPPLSTTIVATATIILKVWEKKINIPYFFYMKSSEVSTSGFPQQTKVWRIHTHFFWKFCDLKQVHPIRWLPACHQMDHSVPMCFSHWWTENLKAWAKINSFQCVVTIGYLIS